MKLIEALNTLKLTQKKLASKKEFVRKYSARPSTVEDPFKVEGKDIGRQKVTEAVQAALDFIKQHEEIKRAIDYTNLVTKVEVAGKEYTIHSLIQHKKEIIRMKRELYSMLSDQQAAMEIAQMRQRAGPEAKLTVQIVYNYDIEKVETEKTNLDELESQIDSALQIANTKIELVMPDEEK